MATFHALLPRDRFLHLPDHGGMSSASRRCGVEIEFTGLSLVETAAQVVALWGGEVREDGPRDLRVTGGRFGTVKVELDISLSRKWAEDVAAQVLGDLVPVEIVTAPMAQVDLPEADHLVRALVAAGAQGTKASLAYGFGVHLNPELPSDPAALVSVARAYAICEDWLRAADPLDPARRVLPFVDPWPRALVTALVEAEGWSVQDLARAYATLAPSRHYGLDLLPALEHLCPETLRDIPDDHLKGGRPAFHYRLPESRLDTDDWSIAYEWNRWCVVEHVAADAALLARLARDFAAQDGLLTRLQGSWPAHVSEVFLASDLPARLGLGSGPSG